MATPKEWAQAFLNRLRDFGLGDVVTENNMAAMVAWADMEGGHYQNSARYNVLNSTQAVAGSYAWGGSIPIQIYDSWSSGIDATIKNLLHGPAWAQPGYNRILAALRDDSSPEVTLQAVKESAWGTTAMDPSNWRALYQSYANYPDPVGGELPAGGGLATTGSSPWLVVSVAAVVLGAAGLLAYRLHGGRRLHLPRLFAARENPVSRRRGKGGGRVQTLLFPRSSFTPSRARQWARSHGFRSGKVDVTSNYVRIRQRPPGGRMRMIQFKNTPVKAVVRYG